MLKDSAIQKSPVFVGLSEDDQNLVCSMMRKRTIATGESVFQQGDSGDSMILVTEGQLMVRFTKKRGQQIDLEPVQAGDVLGELAFLDPAPRSASVVAQAETQILEMDRTMFRSLFEHAPAIASAILKGVMDMVLSRSQRLENRILDALDMRPTVPATPRRPKSRAIGKIVKDALDDPSISIPRGITLQDLHTLSAVASPMTYPIGTVFYEEGDIASSCILLLKGKLRIFRLSEGQEQLLATISAGNIVGHVALVADSGRTATVHAASDVLAIKISRDVFEKLGESRSRLALSFQERLVVDGIRQHRNVIKRLHQVSVLSPWSDEEETQADTEQDEAGPDRRKSSLGARVAMGIEQLRSRAKTDPTVDMPATLHETKTQPASRPPSSKQDKLASAFLASVGEWGITLDEYDSIEVDMTGEQPLSKEQIMARIRRH